jgi:hypothetical protein
LRASLDEESLTEGLGAGQGGERFPGGFVGFVARLLETDTFAVWLQLKSFAAVWAAPDDNSFFR